MFKNEQCSGFTLFTVLYKHRHYPIPQNFHEPTKEFLYLPISTLSPIPDNSVLNVSMYLSILKISHKWTNTIFGLLYFDICIFRSKFHFLKMHSDLIFVCCVR